MAARAVPAPLAAIPNALTVARLILIPVYIALILLWHAGRLPWAALAIPARDLALIAGYKAVVGRGYELAVNFAGKAATWLLYASLAFVMVTRKGADWPLWIFWAGFALAAVALVGYLLKARREVRTA